MWSGLSRRERVSSVGKRAIQVSVFPFVASQLFSEDRLQLLVFMSAPSAKPVSRAMVLRSLYKLNPAEGRVAGPLLEGFDVRQVTALLGITLETGRFHVKRILGKTGTGRQSELTRLILSLSACLSAHRFLTVGQRLTCSQNDWAYLTSSGVDTHSLGTPNDLLQGTLDSLRP